MFDSASVQISDRGGTAKISRTWDLSGNNNYGWIEDFDPWEPLWSIDDNFGFRYFNGVGVDGEWSAPNWNTTGFAEGTLVAVVRAAADPAAIGGVWHNLSDHGAFNHYPYVDGQIYDGFASTTRRNWNPSVPLTDWHIYSARSMASLWKANIDGVEQFSDSSNTVGWGDTKILNEKREIDLAALLVFNKFLNAGELNRLGSYLGQRFSILWHTAAA